MIFFRADWSRAVVYKGIDHRKCLMIAQLLTRHDYLMSISKWRSENHRQSQWRDKQQTKP